MPNSTATPRRPQDSASGLSQLQCRILMLALENQRSGESVHFISADAFQKIYGFTPACSHSKRTPGTQSFRVDEVGRQRYASAKVAIHKAMRRLVDRELVVRMVNIVQRFAGVRLTEQGKIAAERLTANLGADCPQVSHRQAKKLTANLVVKLPPSKPLGANAQAGEGADDE